MEQPARGRRQAWSPLALLGGGGGVRSPRPAPRPGRRTHSCGLAGLSRRSSGGKARCPDLGWGARSVDGFAWPPSSALRLGGRWAGRAGRPPPRGLDATPGGEGEAHPCLGPLRQGHPGQPGGFGGPLAVLLRPSPHPAWAALRVQSLARQCRASSPGAPARPRFVQVALSARKRGTWAPGCCAASCATATACRGPLRPARSTPECSARR